MADFLGLEKCPNPLAEIFERFDPPGGKDYLFESIHYSEQSVYEWYLQHHTDLSPEYFSLLSPQKIEALMEKDGQFYIKQIAIILGGGKSIMIYLVFSKVS